MISETVTHLIIHSMICTQYLHLYLILSLELFLQWNAWCRARVKPWGSGGHYSPSWSRESWTLECNVCQHLDARRCDWWWGKWIRCTWISVGNDKGGSGSRSRLCLDVHTSIYVYGIDRRATGWEEERKNPVAPWVGQEIDKCVCMHWDHTVNCGSN